VIAFPLLFSAVFTAALSGTGRLAGFRGAGSYRAYSVPTTLLQAALLAAVACGTERAEDIEMRFDDRFLLSPLHRAAPTISAILCGGLLSGAAAAVLLGTFEVLGAAPSTGREASAALVLLYAVLGAGASGLVVSLAAWTGSVEAVLGAYAPLMLLTFFSTAFVPARLMAPWFAAIATRNPISWLLTDVRSVYSQGWSPSVYLAALGLAVALSAGATLLAVPFNRRRPRA
jgi:ABC-2 type transport system permease protein